MKLRILVEAQVGNDNLKGYGPWVEVADGSSVLDAVRRAALTLAGQSLAQPTQKDNHDDNANRTTAHAHHQLGAA